MTSSIYLAKLNRRFLFKTFVLVWLVRLGLWLLPFKTVKAVVDRRMPAGQPARWPAPIQIGQAVEAMSRYVPQATCLTQALSAQILLGRYGHSAALRIGVARDETGQFQAHAWVESQDFVVVGGPVAKLQQYTVLPSLEGLKK